MTGRIVEVTSQLIRTANTTAYAQNDLIADTETAGSIVVPSLLVPKRHFLEVLGAHLHSNLGTGATTLSVHVDLWSVAPTFTNGDNGAYVVATGAASWLGNLTSDVVDKNAFADGFAVDLVLGDAYSSVGARPTIIKPLSDGLVYWSMFEVDATGFTPISAQTFDLTLNLRIDN